MALLYGDLDSDYKSQLPQIDGRLVRIRWHSRCFDVVADGVAQYWHVPYWFCTAPRDHRFVQYRDEDGQIWLDWYARLLLIELTEAQFQEQQYLHTEFQKLVGTYWFDEQGIRHNREEARATANWPAFHEVIQSMPKLDLLNNHVLAWFEWLWGSTEVDEFVSEEVLNA